MLNNIFSNRLKAIMIEKDIRQVDLCKKTNIGKSAMSQYISGSFLPKHDKLIAIAKALDVSEDWLMGHEDNKSTEKDDHKMHIIVSDDYMRGAHIPRGSEVLVDMMSYPEPGDIVCYSSGENRNKIRVYSREAGKIILTGSELNCRPTVFSEDDLKNGNLQIHGVANSVVIKL